MREARSITFRLNSRNPDDMEILNWLKQVVDQEHIFYTIWRKAYVSLSSFT